MFALQRFLIYVSVIGGVCLSLTLFAGNAAFAQEEPAAAHAEPAHADAHAADAAHAEGEHHESGPPLSIKGDLLVWSLVSFLLFLVVLGKFAWTPLNAALTQREIHIKNEIRDAENARLKAEQMLAEHEKRLAGVQEEVKGILAEARRDAEQAGLNIKNDANREVSAMRQRAVDEIERAKSHALKELFDVMAGGVVDATERVLGRTVNDNDHQRLIEEALADLPGTGRHG